MRAGRCASYSPNSVRRRRGGHYATLSFVITAPHSRDTLHAAHCYPYTYTDLQRHLASLVPASLGAAASPGYVPAGAAGRVSRAQLCVSLAGNAVDVVTVTAAAGEGGVLPLEQRRGVVLSGVCYTRGLHVQSTPASLPTATSNAV